MRVAVTRSDETIEQLATRVYGLEKPSAAVLRAATGTLSETNPFLRRLSDVPPGTVLAVPDLEHATENAAAEPAEPLVARLAVNQLRGALALLERQLSGDVDAEIADARASAKLARSSELKAFGREAPSLSQDLTGLAKAAEGRADDARALRDHQRQVFDRINADLEEVLRALGG